MSVTSSPILSSDDAQLVRPGDPIDRGASADELIKSCRECLENFLHDDVSFRELRDACKVEFDTLLQEGSYDVNAMNSAASKSSKGVSLGIAEPLLKRSSARHVDGGAKPTIQKEAEFVKSAISERRSEIRL